MSSSATAAQLNLTDHAILILPFTSSLLQNPAPLFPVIANALSNAARQSFTILFSAASPTQLSGQSPGLDEKEGEKPLLYATLRDEPISNFVLFQRFLCKVYTALVYAQMRAGRPLMDVEVHFDGEEGDYAGKLFRGNSNAGKGPDGDVHVQVILAEGVSIPSHLNSLLSNLPSYTVPIPFAYDADALTHTPTNSSDSSSSVQTPASNPTASPYPVVALGGTFDHLHAAHKLLLHLALFLTTRKLIVGVMSDALLASKSDAGLVQKLPERLGEVQRFLLRLGGTYIGASSGDALPCYTEHGLSHGQGGLTPNHDLANTGRDSRSGTVAIGNKLDGRIEIAAAEITDALGPTRYDPDIQALVVSRETISGGKAVNATRREKGLGELELWVVDVIGLPPAGETNSDAELEEMRGMDGVEDEKIIKEMKMGSTGIRRWIAEHAHDPSVAQDDTES
ncbi:hypothetical protein I317_00733 [Kwoniella heveanensis CBS 569]|nr:hypothetical protein I317_00733 [Kwoniella heveanensis CBS 569]